MHERGSSSSAQQGSGSRSPRRVHLRLARVIALAGSAVPTRPIREGQRSRATLRRQAISRRSLALADMVAAGLALVLSAALFQRGRRRRSQRAVMGP